MVRDHIAVTQSTGIISLYRNPARSIASECSPHLQCTCQDSWQVNFVLRKIFAAEHITDFPN